MLGADLSRGERSFKAKCASCHTIEQGGANGTGPNLYATLGAAKQSHAGFNYSGALSNTEGDWTWERMDAWLENPSAYARGTSMAFAGLKRDDERASVLAYLASYSPDAPTPPAPLPEEVVEDETAEDAALEDGEAAPSLDPEVLTSDPTEATGEIVIQDATLGEAVETIAEDTADAVEAPLEGEGADEVEPVVEPSEE